MNYYQTILHQIREQHYPPQYQLQKIIAARNFIDANLCNEIMLKDMAADACLSAFHFIRLFKKCYGRTPHQYLMDARIEKAKELLLAGNNIMQTCYSLGFASTTSFSGLFKKNTGISPSQYRLKKQF
ncbi:MAG: AraC family transcriptional regulator [Chitinophagaceae bacterium]